MVRSLPHLAAAVIAGDALLSDGQPAREHNHARREIALGAIVPSSGPFAEWGRANTVTLKLLEKQVNDAGGVNGAKIRIVIYDDAARPGQATSSLRKLAGVDNVLAIAGPLTSSAAEVAF